MFVFLKNCYDPRVEDGFAEKQKLEAVVVVERRLSGRG